MVSDILEAQRPRRVDTIVGPDRVTKREQVAAISAAVGEDIELKQVTAEEARAFYRAQGRFAAANADFLSASKATTESKVSPTSHTTVAADDDYLDLSRITGKRPRSYQQWAHDHAPDFTGSPVPSPAVDRQQKREDLFRCGSLPAWPA